MKINFISTFTCEICDETYSTADDALKCESRSVTEEKGVKVGDVVKITMGEGSGHLAKVTSAGVHSKEWGHYQWERYWHTVYVVGVVLDGIGGSRLLSFDSYDTV